MAETPTITVSIRRWQLDTPAAMLLCLQELADDGYRGQVRTYQSPAESDEPTLLWDLEINQDNRAPIRAETGGVVVSIGGIIDAMTAEQYDARFGA